MKTTEQIMSLADEYSTAISTQGEAHDHIARDSLQIAIEALVQERDLAQADALEQARLCGMGAEREADLLGKVARLERERDALKAEVKTLRDALEDAIETAVFEKHPSRPWHYKARAALGKKK